MEETEISDFANSLLANENEENSFISLLALGVIRFCFLGEFTSFMKSKIANNHPAKMNKKRSYPSNFSNLFPVTKIIFDMKIITRGTICF